MADRAGNLRKHTFRRFRFEILEQSPAQRVFQAVPVFQQWVRLASEYKWQALGVATCGLEPHGREESIGTTRPDQARGFSISRWVDQPAPIEVLADEIVG